jgi:single-strand DNA-binding protein
MFDTTVTIVGNALNAPELRRTNGSSTLVASFRVASTSRRYDRDSGRWVDGPSLRVRVTCWRRLAEGVTQSVVTGDPLVVTGRMYTRDWVGDDGQHRVSYELEAIAVGHDLSRGFAKFTRHRPAGLTSAVEDSESDARIAGEVSVPVGSPVGSPGGAPVFQPDRQRGDLGDPHRADGPPPTFGPPPMTDSYGDFDPAGPESEGAESAEEDAVNVLRAAGLGGEAHPEGPGAEEPGAEEPGADESGADGADVDGAEANRADRDRPAGRRGRARMPVPA